MLIRPYNPADQDAVILLWRDCGLSTPQNDPIKDIERKMAVGSELFLVAELEGQLVGTVMGGYDGHRGWVNYLAVRPGLQNTGYGRRLMECIEKKLRQLGCAKINLQVRSSNQAVIEFYQQLGYQYDDVVSLGKRLQSDD